jgi:hypothetical protein
VRSHTEAYLPLIDVVNAVNMHYKPLISLSVDPFTRERRQVQFLSANQKATEHWALLKKLSAAIDCRYATRRPLEADLVNPLPENFHREALSVPLAHAAVLMAEYRSANINGALISP